MKVERVKVGVFEDPQIVWEQDEETVRFCPVCYRWDSWTSHFAAYPEALVETPLKASTSEAGCCPKCGAPYARILLDKHEHGAMSKEETVGWRATCECEDLEAVPMRVLDPFCGSGTTGIVAKRLGLDFVGVDVKEEYCDISQKRIGKAPRRDRQMSLSLF